MGWEEVHPKDGSSMAVSGKINWEYGKLKEPSG